METGGDNGSQAPPEVLAVERHQRVIVGCSGRDGMVVWGVIARGHEVADTPWKSRDLAAAPVRQRYLSWDRGDSATGPVRSKRRIIVTELDPPSQDRTAPSGFHHNESLNTEFMLAKSV